MTAKAKRRGPGHEGKFELGERRVDDPLEPGARVTLGANVRESAIAHMASRRRINSSQEAAGERFRALWEHAAIGRCMGIDHTRDAVDGGKAADPITDSLIKAARDLDRAVRAVGMIHSRILMAIAGEGKGIEEMAKAWSKAGGIVSGERAEGYITGTLVDALDALVGHWGLEGKARRKPDLGYYLRNGEPVMVRDHIEGSGLLEITGPAYENYVDRFGDNIRNKLVPLDKTAVIPQISITASKFRRRKGK